MFSAALLRDRLFDLPSDHNAVCAIGLCGDYLALRETRAWRNSFVNLSILILAVLSGLLLAESLILYLWTAVRRHKLDAALIRAATPSNNFQAGPRQIGLVEAWSPDSSLALAVPERRWTYDQDYMIKFIEAAQTQRVPGATRIRFGGEQGDVSALDYYRRSILGLDIWFAIAFALFIVCAALLAAEWFAGWLWLARAWVIVACMGILYGVADVAEDIKLRRILDHAERLARLKKGDHETSPRDTVEADAAQVDAANTLTRVKLVTVSLSLIGLVAFVIFRAVESLTVRVPPPGDPSPDMTATGTT